MENMRTVDEIVEAALSGSGPFPMTREEVIAIAIEDPYATYMRELPTNCCGRPIRMVDQVAVEYALIPGGEVLYVGGAFTKPGDYDRMITKWAGTIRSGAIWDRPLTPSWNGKTWQDTGWRCDYCGGIATLSYACTQCGAPTRTWWARLDQMIANWKRGT